MKYQLSDPAMPEIHGGLLRWRYPDGTLRVVPYCSGACPYGQVGDRLWVRETSLPKASGKIYRADFSEFDAAGLGGMYGGWKPSIFCKREHSRITLEIVEVRVEKLNDISQADAQAEGWNQFADDGRNPAPLDPRSWYRGLWDQINGNGSWERNPWVWVIKFRCG